MPKIAPALLAVLALCAGATLAGAAQAAPKGVQHDTLDNGGKTGPDVNNCTKPCAGIAAKTVKPKKPAVKADTISGPTKPPL